MNCWGLTIQKKKKKTITIVLSYDPVSVTHMSCWFFSISRNMNSLVSTVISSTGDSVSVFILHTESHNLALCKKKIDDIMTVELFSPWRLLGRFCYCLKSDNSWGNKCDIMLFSSNWRTCVFLLHSSTGRWEVIELIAATQELLSNGAK